jgi:hypothetical protein
MLFDRAVEALWDPGRTAWISEVVSPGSAAGGSPIIHMAAGVLGPTGRTRFESLAMAETIEALLGAPASPYAADPENPAAFFNVRPEELRHSAIIRQRVVTISHPDAVLSVLSRWHATIDPWSGVLRLLAERQAATRVRASVLATELSLGDHVSLEAALNTLHALAYLPGQRADLSFELHRATQTLIDIKASFGSPLLVVEIAVTSPQPLAESTVRAIAAQFTSQADVHRAPTHTAVASQSIILGGYEIEREPTRLREAHEAGLPLYGGVCPRSIRDVVSLTESPIKWPLPGSTGIVSVPFTLRRHLPIPECLRTGQSLGRGQRDGFVGLPAELAGSHCLLIGTTGCGKSTAMVAAALADLRAGRPFFFLDPHGTAADMLVAHAQALGVKIALFDPADANSLRLSPVPALRKDGRNLEDVDLAIGHFSDAVATNYSDPGWSGPRWLQHARAIAYLSATHRISLGDAVSWYADPARRRSAILHPALPDSARATLRLLDAPGNNDAASVIDWVTCKFQGLLEGSAGRLLAAPGAGVRVQDMLRDGCPVIVNLAGLAPSNVGILGHVLLAGVLDAAMSRPAGERCPYRLYVDEIHRFPTRNLERGMNESRKFSVSVWVASQSLAILGDQLADTIAGAAAVKFVFRVSPDSASRLAPLLGVAREQLVNQPDLFCHLKAGESVTTIEIPAYEPVPVRPKTVPKHVAARARKVRGIVAPGASRLENVTANSTADSASQLLQAWRTHTDGRFPGL